MDTKALDYLVPIDPQDLDVGEDDDDVNGDGTKAGGSNKLYLGPSHVIDDPTNIPSISTIINESRHRTGVYVPDQHICAMDQEWYESLKRCFSDGDVNSKFQNELDEFLMTGRSNGRKLRLQVMVFPPGLFFKIHAHPNIEFELTLSGCLQEFRFLFHVPPDTLRKEGGNDDDVSPLSGPAIGRNDVFEHKMVEAGQCMINETGSVHQSFTGTDRPCSILVLWSGCHANTRPENVNTDDGRLQPTAGW